MGNYKLNNIDLEDYGIVAMQAPGSSLATIGAFDLPKRKGKAFHSWADREGVQPWFDADLMHYEGRDIDYYGLISGVDRDDIKSKIDFFYQDIDAFSDLKNLSIFGRLHNVYIRGQIEVKYLGQACASIMIPFREPIVPQFELPLPVEPNAANLEGFDRIGFDLWSVTPISLKNRYDRPEPHAVNALAYSYEGYQINQPRHKEIEFRGLIQGTAGAFRGWVDVLQTLFCQPKSVLLKMPGDVTREVMLVDGFTVSNVRMTNEFSGIITMRLIELGIVPDEAFKTFDYTFDNTFG